MTIPEYLCAFGLLTFLPLSVFSPLYTAYKWQGSFAERVLLTLLASVCLVSFYTDPVITEPSAFYSLPSNIFITLLFIITEYAKGRTRSFLNSALKFVTLRIAGTALFGLVTHYTNISIFMLLYAVLPLVYFVYFRPTSEEFLKETSPVCSLLGLVGFGEARNIGSALVRMVCTVIPLIMSDKEYEEITPQATALQILKSRTTPAHRPLPMDYDEEELFGSIRDIPNFRYE